MALEASRQLERGGAGAVRSQAQGRQAAEGQPAFEGVAGLTEGRGDGPDPVDPVARAGDHAQGQVAVAADQLGHGVHDERGPQRQGPAEERSEGLVDQDGHVRLAADPRDRFEVGDAEQGIGDRLDQDEPGVRRDQACELLGMGGIEAVVGDAEPDHFPGDERGRLAVESLREDHVVALADQGEHGRRDGGHPGGADQGGLRALDLGHLGGELDRVGMSVAGVEEAGEPAVVEAVHLVQVGDLVDGAQLERRGQGPADGSRPRGGCGHSEWHHREGDPGTSRPHSSDFSISALAAPVLLR